MGIVEQEHDIAATKETGDGGVISNMGHHSESDHEMGPIAVPHDLLIFRSGFVLLVEPDTLMQAYNLSIQVVWGRRIAMKSSLGNLMI